MYMYMYLAEGHCIVLPCPPETLCNCRRSVMSCESSKQWTGTCSWRGKVSELSSASWAATSLSTVHTSGLFFLLRHLTAKWFRFWHLRQDFPNAGHSSLLCVSCCLPQLGHSWWDVTGVLTALTFVPMLYSMRQKKLDGSNGTLKFGYANVTFS